MSSSEALTSRNHIFSFFLSPDFYELRRSVNSICLFTEVKQQWATLVLRWVTIELWDVSELEFLCVPKLT